MNMLSNSHIKALGKATKRIWRIIATTPLCAMLAYFCLHIAGICSLSSCRIEPPLLLAEQLPIIRLALGDVVTDLNIVWNIETDWRKYWWYGWDDEDIKLFGDIAYPEPTNFEGRFYFYGEEPTTTWLRVERQTIYETSFRRRFDFGYHDMLLWSNVETSDGTQALYIDEHDLGNISATTSRSRLSYMLPSRSTEVYNNPEIFYSGSADNIFISRDTTQYDYYDPVRDAWIKEIPADLYPMVYIYLVQVAIYNNRGRVKGITDQLQRQVHGGIVTVEIDADTIDMPGSRSYAGGLDGSRDN